MDHLHHSIIFERMLVSCMEHLIAILSNQERYIKNIEETVLIQRRTLNDLSRRIRKLERERLHPSTKE